MFLLSREQVLNELYGDENIKHCARCGKRVEDIDGRYRTEALERGAWFCSDCAACSSEMGVSRRRCECCNVRIPYTEDVCLLEVGEAAIEDGRVVWQPLEDKEGDYKYEPLMLDLMCAEELLDNMMAEVADYPPPPPHRRSQLHCRVCEHPIAQMYPMVAFTYGELQVTQRRGTMTDARDLKYNSDKFEKLSETFSVCLECMAFVVDEHLDVWAVVLDDLEVERPLEQQEEED